MKSFNYKNKENVANAIAHILNSNISDFIKDILIDRLLWVATEVNDKNQKRKYDGIPFWSKGAIKQVIMNRSGENKFDYSLIHEHPVPKKVLKELISSTKGNYESILKLLNELAHGVIISKSEHDNLAAKGLKDSLPEKEISNLKFDNLFNRYKKCGIVVVNIGNLSTKSCEIIELKKFIK